MSNHGQDSLLNFLHFTRSGLQTHLMTYMLPRMMAKIKEVYTTLEGYNDELSNLQTCGIVEGWEEKLCCKYGHDGDVTVC